MSCCYTDASLSKGDISRLSWALLRRKSEPPHSVLLTSDSSTDPGISVVAFSLPSLIDPHEEVSSFTFGPFLYPLLIFNVIEFR